MTHLLNTEHIDRFTVLNSDGEYVTGETFLVDQARDPVGDPFDYTITELGSGLYQVAFTPVTEGGYYLRLVTNTVQVDPPQIYESYVATHEGVAGETSLRYFSVLDDDGAYVTGSTITIDATYDPSGGPFAPIVEELTLGLYRLSWVPVIPGLYSVRLVATSTPGDEDQVFDFAFQIEPAIPAPVPLFEPVYGPTLDDLVREVALLCRDYYDVLATDNATDNETWPDSLGLAARPPKMFKGASLYVVESGNADNVGKEVRVLDSVNNALTLIPALPGAVRRLDRAYLTNLESAGFARQTYVNQINARIQQIFPIALRPASWTATDTFNGQAPWITPPPEFTHLSSVSYPSGAYTIPEIEIPQEDLNRPGWSWDGANDRILLTGGYADVAHGLPVTLRGFGRWQPLAEGEATGVMAWWLVEMTAGVMILSTRDPRRQSEAAMHINRADALLMSAATQLPPNTIKIRG